MALWRRREPDLDTELPQQWPTRRGPLVLVEVAGTEHCQGDLTRLHRKISPESWLPIIAHPEPDNPQDPSAVAVLAAGRFVGYLSGAYAVLWHPVVRSEHERGRIVTGMGQLSQDPDGRTGLRAFLMQPPRPGTSPCRSSSRCAPGRGTAATSGRPGT